jgi:hypothetical protein
LTVVFPSDLEALGEGLHIPLQLLQVTLFLHVLIALHCLQIFHFVEVLHYCLLGLNSAVFDVFGDELSEILGLDTGDLI